MPSQFSRWTNSEIVMIPIADGRIACARGAPKRVGRARFVPAIGATCGHRVLRAYGGRLPSSHNHSASTDAAHLVRLRCRIRVVAGVSSVFGTASRSGHRFT
jgi:hypothetical protein